MRSRPHIEMSIDLSVNVDFLSKNQQFVGA